MRAFLLGIVLLLASLPSECKVYDCFPFFNELELLKMRLEELDAHVDNFVLVESIETQRGNPKPLFFEENKHLFAEYLPKIIHVAVKESHPEFSLWQRENYQRNAILRGLTSCEEGDIIIISDLDEIPRKSAVQQFKQIYHAPFKTKKNHAQNYYQAFSLEMGSYFFQLNRQTKTKETWTGGAWIGTVAARYADVKKLSPQYFRDKRHTFIKIPNGGWHFSWMGGIDKVREKLISVVEGNPDGKSISDEEIALWFANHPLVEIDSSFPEYVQRNEGYLRSIGFIGAE